MQKTTGNTSKESPTTKKRTQKKEPYGGGDTKQKLVSWCHTPSMNSALPGSISKEPWTQPNTLKALARQANIVSTRVLNGSIDLKTAMVYSALIRSISQMAGAELMKARLTEQAPDLSL